MEAKPFDSFPHDDSGCLVLDPAVEKRFWRYVVRGSQDECWEWQGNRLQGNYGTFRLGRAMFPAHRVAYALTTRVPKPDVILRHMCNNRPCVNPSHLVEGTHADNAQDRIDSVRHGRLIPDAYRPAGYRSIGPARVAVSERFWAKVDRSGGASSCWQWIGQRVGDKPYQYGAMKVGGANARAHRISYEMHFGPVPEGCEVLHLCNNRLCVNPEHLRAGTHAENMRQRATDKGPKPPPSGPMAGRHWMHLHPERKLTGDRNPLRLHPELRRFGPENPMSKLTDAQKTQIIRRRQAGESGAALSREYGVTRTYIYQLAIHGT